MNRQLSMPHLFFVLIILFFSQALYSQIRVVDINTKLPVPAVKATGRQIETTLSDLHGVIQIKRPLGDTVYISHPGYQSRQIIFDKNIGFLTIELIPDVVNLKETVVSAGKLNQTLNQTPARIDLIQLQDASTLLDITGNSLLMSVPGLTLQEGTHTTSRITIRGIGSRNPYGTNRIKAYLGAIPITSGEGTTALEDISPTSLGRIEVIKGPSHLYGAGIGGVILLHPSYPQHQGTSVEIAQAFGSFASLNTSAGVAHKTKAWSLNSHLTQTSSDGFRENNQFKRKNALLTANWFGKKHQLQILFNYSTVFGQIPSSLNFSDFTENPQQAAPNWLAVKGHEDYYKLSGGLTLTSDISNKLQNSLTLYNHLSNHYESRPFNILDDQSAISGFREFLNYTMGPVKFILGIELMHERFKWKTFETNNGLKVDMINNFIEDRFQNDNLLAINYDLNAQISLSGSLTISHFSYDLGVPGSQEEGLQTFNSKVILSPRIAINYIPPGSFRIFGSYAEGYAPASVEESLLPEGIVNPDLSPETSKSFELGADFSRLNDRLHLSTSLYHMQVENMLVNKRLSEDMFMAVNAGKTILQGLELSSRYHFLKSKKHALRAELFFLISDNRFTDFTDDGVDYSGKKLPAIPSYTASTNLLYTFSGTWTLKGTFQQRGKQFLNDSNELSYNGFPLADLETSYSKAMGKLVQLVIYGKIRNLSNQHYASMLIPNATAFGTAEPRYYYPGSPRSAQLGLRIKWTHD